jgi:hypothetical protein
MNNRRLLFIVALVLLFSVVVLVWYFFYVKPVTAPSLGQPTNALPVSAFSRGFQFIFGDDTPPESVTTTAVTPASAQVLAEIWNKPATGAAFATQQILIEVDATTTVKGTTTPIFIKKTIRATSTLLMFVDRTTGYVYGYDMESGALHQVTNTTLIGVHDAYIFDNGKRLAARYYDQNREVISTIVATIPTTSPNASPRPLENMTSLPLEVSSVAINKKGDKLSYLVPNTNGSSIYTLTTKTGALVATSAFSEWALSYGGDTLYATSKPSAYVLGMTVQIPSFEYRMGNKTGLMSNSSDKGTFLNSVWTNSGLATFISKTQSEVVLTSKTLASKCAWGVKEFLVCAVPRSLPLAEEGLPDDWFQGRFFFDDDLYLIDTTLGASYPLYAFDPEKGEMDLTNLVVSSDNNSISFIRKQNGSLWLLRVDRIVSQ